MRRAVKPVGICGQAPSGYPDFARPLVGQGIDTISLNPDTAIEIAHAIFADDGVRNVAAGASGVDGEELRTPSRSRACCC